jgi:2-polyprenyl-3-methyl-5-hydroxy-6-metoxy-1,4-benzoquinol methylase
MKHWTEELFVDNPELFFILFDERPERMKMEVDALLKSLNGDGYQPQRLLDMNCGIGRHSVELAKKGIEVLGTDISPRYIEIATKKAREAGVGNRDRFKVADMRRIFTSLKDEKPFDGIINLWTSFGFYDDDTNDDILRQCLKLVKPGGFFAMDIVNRDWLVRNFQPRGFHKIGDMTVLEDRTFNMNDSRMYNTWTFMKIAAENTYTLLKEAKLDHRVWSLHELIAMFARTGWKFKAAYSGLAPGPDLGAGIPISGEREVFRAPRLLIISYRE